MSAAPSPVRSSPERLASPPPPPQPSRRDRPRRACTNRSTHLLSDSPPSLPTFFTKDNHDSPQKCAGGSGGGGASKVITPLVPPAPPPGQEPRWALRSMGELASVLNFLHIFRPLLNVGIEFSAEELETALITPNSTLDDIHIPLLRAIPPITRMALGRGTWVTVLCRKLRDWWHWVADGDIPIVASHGTECETYKNLDPATRVLILKALCDIRVEQEDIRSYIDNSLKHRVHLSTFRKERIGGDSQGTSYWYEDDPIVGHRLYREIRKIEVIKKGKGKGAPSIPIISCQWETVSSNLDEFQEVSDKLLASKNRTEVSLGKRLKIDIIPEVERIHKKKERLLKKQHREALLLDSYLNTDGLVAAGRALRDRKPVTYTFDDYDRSINEAIKITKRRHGSPEPTVKREGILKPDATANGSRWNVLSEMPQDLPYDYPSPKSPKSTELEEMDMDQDDEHLDRNNRRRRRPQRYSEKEFVEAVSENEEGLDSDDDIVGEAVYDDEYLRSRKQRRGVSSSSEGDEEYQLEEEKDEDDDEENSLSSSEVDEEPRKTRSFSTRNRRGAKLKSVGELQLGLRRSKRSTRTRIDYRKCEMSDSEADSIKSNKLNGIEEHSESSNNVQYSGGSEDSHEDVDKGKDPLPVEKFTESMQREESKTLDKAASPPAPETESVRGRHFLDLNEVAPGNGFDDDPYTSIKDEETD